MSESILYKGEKPLYINKTTLSKATAKEFLAISWRKGAGWMRIAMLVVAGVAGVYGLVQLFLYGFAALGQTLSMVLLAGVAFFLGQWGYKLRSRAYLMKQEATWGDKTLDKTVYFYKDVIVQRSRLGEMEFRYSDLTDVYDGKSLLIARLQDGSLVLQKAGFEDVDWEEVAAFLREQVPERPKKSFKERMSERMQGAAAQRSGAARTPTRTGAAGDDGDDDDDDEDADKDDDGTFDITDDSWVDAMDAEEEARRAAGGEKGGDGKA